MACKRLLCTGCKTRFDREVMIRLPAGNFHSLDCATEYSRAKSYKDKAKREKKEHVQRKKAFYANDIKTRKAAAKLAFHTYIKVRDKDQDCICCGRELGHSFHAGHFLESGNNPAIRYHEDNVWGQKIYCNMYQGGNSDDYEGRLRAKIGDERVDWLISQKGGSMKRSAADYREIETHYKQKLKELISA